MIPSHKENYSSNLIYMTKILMMILKKKINQNGGKNYFVVQKKANQQMKIKIKYKIHYFNLRMNLIKLDLKSNRIRYKRVRS